MTSFAARWLAGGHARQHHAHGDVPAAFEAKPKAEEDHPDQAEEAQLLDPGELRREGGRQLAHADIERVGKRHRQHDGTDDDALDAAQRLHRNAQKPSFLRSSS